MNKIEVAKAMVGKEYKSIPHDKIGKVVAVVDAETLSVQFDNSDRVEVDIFDLRSTHG
jgi:hypothetical protein